MVLLRGARRNRRPRPTTAKKSDYPRQNNLSFRCHVGINSLDVYRGKITEMEVVLCRPLDVNPRDPLCIDRLKAFLGFRKAEEERMFSRLLLGDSSGVHGLGKSSTKATQKEV